jgi:hypothetical protein
VVGNLYIEAGGTISGDTTISGGGKVYAAANVDTAAALSLIPTFTGTVVQTTQNGVLTSTTYTGGTPGATAPVTGIFYNLEGGSNAGKAYSYNEQGEPTPVNTPKFNLTGDGKAYNWNNGVKGSLFTGVIDGVTYTNGVEGTGGGGGGASYNEYAVTFEGSSGTLYTSLSDTVTSGTVYSDSALNLPFTGAFEYNSVWYYADAGVPNTYRAYGVSGDTNGGVLYSYPVFNAEPDEFIYTNTALTAKYTGEYQYQGVFYYAEDGVVGQLKPVTVTGDSNDGVLYIAADSGISVGATGSPVFTDFTGDTPYEGPFVYNGAYFRANNAGAWTAFDGVAQAAINGSYYNVVNGSLDLASTNYAVGVKLFFADNRYYTFDGDGLAGIAFNGAVDAENSWYEVVNGLSVGLFNGIAKDADNNYIKITSGSNVGQNIPDGGHKFAEDGLYYLFENGQLVRLFEGGAPGANGTYYKVDQGVLTSNVFAGAGYNQWGQAMDFNGGLSGIATRGYKQLVSDGRHYYFNTIYGGGPAIKQTVAILTPDGYRVADDGFVTDEVFSGLYQEFFDAGQYADGSRYLMINNGSGGIFSGTAYDQVTGLVLKIVNGESLGGHTSVFADSYIDGDGAFVNYNISELYEGYYYNNGLPYNGLIGFSTPVTDEYNVVVGTSQGAGSFAFYLGWPEGEIASGATAKCTTISVSANGNVMTIAGDVDYGGLSSYPSKMVLYNAQVSGNVRAIANGNNLMGSPAGVGGDFNCNNLGITSLKGAPITVAGTFNCSYNYLTSLQYSPTAVGIFNCFHNQLNSLQGAPAVVNGFNCGINQLASLQGVPATVYGDFDCSGNQLTSLQGSPATVTGNYICSNNSLTSLQGVLASVQGDFDCTTNQLTSLQGAPAMGGNGSFYCSDNQLTTLQGAPTEVRGNFMCVGNQLTSLQGAPAVVQGVFNCSDNLITSLQGGPTSIPGVYNIGQYICANNQLTSLQGAPTTVIFYFDCGYNQLTNLVGGPVTVLNGSYNFSHNPLLTSLSGSPDNVNAGTVYYNNTGLTLPTVAASVGGTLFIYSVSGVGRQAVAATGGTPTSFAYYLDGVLSNSFTTTTPTKAVDNGNFYTYTNGVPTFEKAGVIAGRTVTYSDGQYRITGDISIQSQMAQLPDFSGIHLNGSFYCGGKGLTSLQGAPAQVTGSFHCQGNPITNLQGAPSYVGGDLVCGEFATFTSLQGGPTTVGGYFRCRNSQITSLQYGPTTVGGDYICDNNQLTSIQGAPTSLTRVFLCNNNQITSLQGGPTGWISGYNCSYNQLTNLQGAPSNIGEGFNCSNNPLTSLQGAPGTVLNFDCSYTNITGLDMGPLQGIRSYTCTNTKITSLIGAPSVVGTVNSSNPGGFYCNNNAFLTTLIGSPHTVYGAFSCHSCSSLTSFQGAPDTVTGLFNFTTSVISLPKAFLTATEKAAIYAASGVTRLSPNPSGSLLSIGYFTPSGRDESYSSTVPQKAEDSNYYLYSNGYAIFDRVGTVAGIELQYANGRYETIGSVSLSNRGLTALPDFTGVHIKGSFSCNNNLLTDLQKAPASIQGDFNCSYNQITYLRCPTTSVGGAFNCGNNPLINLYDMPPVISGAVQYANTPNVTPLPGLHLDNTGVWWIYNASRTGRTLAIPATGSRALSIGYYVNGELATSYTSNTPTKAEDNNFYTYSQGSPNLHRVGTVAGYVLDYEAGEYVYNGNVDLMSRGLTSLPNFSGVYVKGNFYCGLNQLTSLTGAPSRVLYHFGCQGNQLTSLQGAPSVVGLSYDCSVNQLTSLQYCATTIGGDFRCHNNQLTSLQYGPTSVSGDFLISNNQITSLQYMPTTLGGGIHASSNLLASLQYCPATVNGAFNVSNNRLTSLQYGPATVTSFYNCANNLISNMQYAPSSVPEQYITYGPNPNLALPRTDADVAGVLWNYGAAGYMRTRA